MRQLRGMLVALSLVFLLVATAQAVVTTGGADSNEQGKTIHLILMIVYASTAIFFSFVCSVAEAVILSVSPSYIVTLEEAGKKNAKLLGSVKKDIDNSLAAILTLNTIAHTVGAGGAGAEAAAYFGDGYVGISMAVLTLLILFLSEIVPKTLGAVYWRALASPTALFIRGLSWLLFPLLFISQLVTKWIARGKSVHGVSRDELAAMADIGAEAGQLDETESRILRNLFRFPGLRAEDIMTPRTVAFALQEDLTVAEVLEEHKEIHFSRIPIFAKSKDEVTGFVLKTDLLLNQHTGGGKAKLRDFKREIRGVHEQTPLSKVLEDVLDLRTHIMLVTDDYGGLEGIVTLEDVVETLIGIEIVDEADQIDDMRRLARQKWETRMRNAGIDILKPDTGGEEKS